MDGGGLAGTVFIVFLILKLTHTITWSWWWVTSPIWIDVALTLLLLLLMAVFGISGFGLFKLVESRKRRARAKSGYRSRR